MTYQELLIFSSRRVVTPLIGQLTAGRAHTLQTCSRSISGISHLLLTAIPLLGDEHLLEARPVVFVESVAATLAVCKISLVDGPQSSDVP